MPDKREKSWRELDVEFHTALGRCIAAWAQVDEELFGIFRKCVGPIVQCAIIYYRTPGLDSRVELTHEIVKSVLSPRGQPIDGHVRAKIDNWTITKNKFRTLLPTRRRLAHHPVGLKGGPVLGPTPFGDVPYGYWGDAHTPEWFEVYVNQHEKLRTKEAGTPGLKIDDLKKHSSEVAGLSTELHRFSREVLDKLPSIPTRQDRKPNPRTIPRGGSGR